MSEIRSTRVQEKIDEIINKGGLYTYEDFSCNDGRHMVIEMQSNLSNTGSYRMKDGNLFTFYLYKKDTLKTSFYVYYDERYANIVSSNITNKEILSTYIIDAENIIPDIIKSVNIWLTKNKIDNIYSSALFKIITEKVNEYRDLPDFNDTVKDIMNSTIMKNQLKVQDRYAILRYLQRFGLIEFGSSNTTIPSDENICYIRPLFFNYKHVFKFCIDSNEDLVFDYNGKKSSDFEKIYNINKEFGTRFKKYKDIIMEIMNYKRDLFINNTLNMRYYFDNPMLTLDIDYMKLNIDQKGYGCNEDLSISLDYKKNLGIYYYTIKSAYSEPTDPKSKVTMTRNTVYNNKDIVPIIFKEYFNKNILQEDGNYNLDILDEAEMIFYNTFDKYFNTIPLNQDEAHYFKKLEGNVRLLYEDIKKLEGEYTNDFRRSLDTKMKNIIKVIELAKFTHKGSLASIAIEKSDHSIMWKIIVNGRKVDGKDANIEKVLLDLLEYLYAVYYLIYNIDKRASLIVLPDGMILKDDISIDDNQMKEIIKDNFKYDLNKAKIIK